MGKKQSKMDLIHLSDAFIMKKAQLAKNNVDEVVSRYEGEDREKAEKRLSSLIQCAEIIYTLDKKPVPYEDVSDGDGKHLRKVVDMLDKMMKSTSDLLFYVQIRRVKSWYKLWLDVYEFQKTENSLNSAMAAFDVDPSVYEDDDLKTFINNTSGSYQGDHRTFKG